MKTERILPGIIAASALGLSATLPAVQAADDTGRSIEQRSEQLQGAIKDAWLDGKLESALLFNEHINSFNVDTDVRNGVAYLSGAVESDIDRDLAGEIAMSIDGVSDVRNELVIDRDRARAAGESEDARIRQGFKQKVSNATMTARVKSRLLLNNNTSGLAIDVDSSNGAITLSGQVDSEQEKELAEKIAANTSGARSVDNQLSVDREEQEEAE